MRLPKGLLVGLWPWAVNDAQTPEALPPSTPIPASSKLSFTLRHIHGHRGSQVALKDISPSDLVRIQTSNPDYQTTFDIPPVRVKTYKPREQAQFFRVREASVRRAWMQRRGFPISVLDKEEVVIWDEWEVPGPNTGDRETLRTLAKMTWNAYIPPDDGQWYDLGEDWGTTMPFGWEPDADGLRGHVFVTNNNDTVVVSIKGTSAGAFGGGGPTVGNDKLNDNLLFSCCCARVGPTWSPVCGCFGGRNRCDENCVQEALANDSLFYPVGTNLYNNITYMYPNANIWFTGHSLGGSLSGLLGVTFGSPVVSFESPGDRMPARRLHLPKPPDLQHITHIFHTADPIPMGTCNGVLSSCAIAGFAMESRCHVGKKRLYDTVSRYGWSQDVRTHRIGVIIDKLLAEDWEEGKPVPDETSDGEDCEQQECYSWEYGDFNLSLASP